MEARNKTDHREVDFWETPSHLLPRAAVILLAHQMVSLTTTDQLDVEQMAQGNFSSQIAPSSILVLKVCEQVI